MIIIIYIYILTYIYIYIFNVYIICITYVLIFLYFYSIHSLTASFLPHRMKRCPICCRGIPSWDTHQQCPRHRACSRLAPCSVCTGWAPTLWDLAEVWLSKHPLIQRGLTANGGRAASRCPGPPKRGSNPPTGSAGGYRVRLGRVALGAPRLGGQ